MSSVSITSTNTAANSKPRRRKQHLSSTYRLVGVSPLDDNSWAHRIRRGERAAYNALRERMSLDYMDDAVDVDIDESDDRKPIGKLLNELDIRGIPFSKHTVDGRPAFRLGQIGIFPAI